MIFSLCVTTAQTIATRFVAHTFKINQFLMFFLYYRYHGKIFEGKITK